MTDRSFLVVAFFGQPRRFCCCWEHGPPRSSGQVSNATHGVMAMRATSGHLIGFLFGLAFILPPSVFEFDSSCHSSADFPTGLRLAPRLFHYIKYYFHLILQLAEQTRTVMLQNYPLIARILT